MARVVMYTTQYCSYCVQAKRLLNRKGIVFEEIDVSRDAELRRTMIQKAGGRLTSQIFVDDSISATRESHMIRQSLEVLNPHER
jgi:glutaredoxin 3